MYRSYKRDRIAKPVPAKSVVIKACDDFFIVGRKSHAFRHNFYFHRVPNGDITVIWVDPDSDVTSFGPGDKRRALYVNHHIALDKRRPPMLRKTTK